MGINSSLTDEKERNSIKMSLIEFQNVTRTYSTSETSTTVLNDVSIELDEGKFIVILGPSGAGKSTFLNLLGGLDSPTSGKIIVDGEDISTLSDNELADYRAKKVGFIFQFYNLIPTLTVYENVNLIKEIVPDSLPTEDVLAEVGMQKHLKKFPTALSGGEQQRVSIARALAKDPQILLCDEPTGALDSATGIIVLKALQNLTRTRGKTVVTVTHDVDIAKLADVVIRIRDGKIESCTTNEEPLNAEDIKW